jgi:hypothetical protein
LLICNGGGKVSCLLCNDVAMKKGIKKWRFYVIEKAGWGSRCKMNNMETLLQFVALKEVTDIGNINALVKRSA